MIRKLLPHICITLSLVTLTFVILYQFNPGLFVTPFFQVMLVIYSIATIAASLLSLNTAGKKNNKAFNNQRRNK